MNASVTCPLRAFHVVVLVDLVLSLVIKASAVKVVSERVEIAYFLEDQSTSGDIVHP